MRKIIFSVLICIILGANARTLVIVSDPLSEPVPAATCVLFNERNDSLGYIISNSAGIAGYDNNNVSSLEIQAEGYNKKYINLSSLKTDTIYLKPIKMLDEVVVLPENVKDLGNKISYRIPMADMNRYTDFYQALNEIPFLTVLPSGGAYFKGESNIAFLLNGVETTSAELQTISKEDISKIEVYNNPPARFVAQGISAVIDVRTKSNLTGGNVGLNVDQAFLPVKGSNSAAFYYNYKRSRFSLLYSGDNSHYDKYEQNENLEYTFEDVEYKKTKKGIGSDADTDNNNLSVSFQNNKSNDYLYNLQIGVGFDRNKMDLLQDVITETNQFTANNFLNTRYNKFNVANYFEKRLGGDSDKGTILANINYQNFKTRYISSYQEFSEVAEIDVVNNYSAYKTRLDGIFAEIQYEFPHGKLGYLSLCAFDSYKHSRYTDAVFPFYQTTNTVGGNIGWIGTKNQLNWYATFGVSANHISTTNLIKSYNVVIPNPKVILTWIPIQNVYLRGTYTYSLDIPSIAQLSETDQWLDTRLVYHGNATLKASKLHSGSFMGGLNSRYIEAALSVNYEYSPDKICNQYLTTDRYMLETIVNLDSYHELTGMLDITLKPLGNNKLTFWNRLIAGNVRGANEYYRWSGYRFQWMSVLTLNLNKWTFAAFYQYPGKVAEGQLIRPRPECWYVQAYFRPVNNLSVGLKWFMPFGNSFGDSEHTVKDAPVFFEKACSIKDGANYVALELSWNLSFGRNQNRARPQFGNGDNDSGLLRKE